MEHVSRDNRVISRQTMNNALELSALLIDHALTAFELFGVDKQTENTKRVYEWIKSNGQRFFKQNDCHKALHGQFAKISELRDVLAELMERNIISKSEQIKTGGRPSIINYVNPAIFGDVNCWAGVKFSKHQLRILVILVTKVSTMKTLVAFVT